MAINVSLAENHHQQSANKKIIPRTKIKVFGIGGAGSNAVDSMIRTSMEGVDFVACNTDQQTLENSLAETKIQLGAQTTQGLGTGSDPKTGAQAAHEALDEIKEMISNTQLLFLTAGMGGGTGTGAISVIAKIARDMGVLTVAVVTKPFGFEGERRLKAAKIGIRNLGKYVDTLVVIDNQNLFAIADETTTFTDAFNMTNDVVASGIKGVTDLMTMPGIINLDFSDITTIMGERGKALIGTAEEEGEDRAIRAAERALNNQLLDDVKLEHATGILVNVTGGDDLGLLEVDRAVSMIKEAASDNAQLIFGASASQKLQGKIRITILATGITHHHSEMPTEEVEHEAETPETPETPENSATSEAGQQPQAEAEIINIDEIRQEYQQQTAEEIPETTPEVTETPIQQAQPMQQPQQAQQYQAQQMPQPQQQAQQYQAPYLNRNGNALPIHEMVISDDPINVPHHYQQQSQQMPIQNATGQNPPIQNSTGQNPPIQNSTGQNSTGQNHNAQANYQGNPAPQETYPAPQGTYNAPQENYQGNHPAPQENYQGNIQGDNIDVNNYDANLKLEQLRAKIHFANHANPQQQIDNHAMQDIKQVQSQLDEISMNTQHLANRQNSQHHQIPHQHQHSQYNSTGMVAHIQNMKPILQPQYDTDQYDTDQHDTDQHDTDQHDANQDTNQHDIAHDTDQYNEYDNDINIADDAYHHAQYDEYNDHEPYEVDAQYEEEAEEDNSPQTEIEVQPSATRVNIKRHASSQHQAQERSPNQTRSKKMPFKLKRGGDPIENNQAENNQPSSESSNKKRDFSNKAKIESFDLPFDDKASDEDVAKEAVNGGKMLSRKELDIPAFLRRQAN